MRFTLITTVSPEFREKAERYFFPTWHANAGAAEIVIHPIDGGTWAGNILQRMEIIRKEVLDRQGERILFLDADCIVLRDLAGGFSAKHILSVARWPNINMGVAFFNLALPFFWAPFLDRILEQLRRRVEKRLRRGTNPMEECDQAVWRPYLQTLGTRQIGRLPEWKWNYSEFDLPQWYIELPDLQPLVRVLHIKGHGDWKFAKLVHKVAYAKALWPKELACIK